MTDDLVKRLRDEGIAEMDEAADRIEKLEAALREIIERAEYRMSHSVSDDTCLIARKALEGKDD
jgi:regulator of sigma D